MTIDINTIVRQSWLLAICCTAIGALGSTIINNPTKSTLSAANTQNFPQATSLPNLQQIEYKPLSAHKFTNGTVAIGQQYRYRQPSPDRQVAIQVRYITDGVANQPSMDRLLPAFTDIPATALSPKSIKQQPDVGFYSSFIHRDTAYFTTCINPQGITTVKGDQFHANSNPNLFTSLPVNRLLPWLLGRQTLRDSRCIWTVLSTPIDRATPDATMKTLETIGVTWIRWWQVHFPAA